MIHIVKIKMNAKGIDKMLLFGIDTYYLLHLVKPVIAENEYLLVNKMNSFYLL